MGYYISIAILWHGISISSAWAQESYALETSATALLNSRAILQSSVGIKETGCNNCGHDIDKILAPLNLRRVAWCQAFQYYCFWATGESVPIKKTAGSQDCFNDARRRGRKVPFHAEIDALMIYRTVNSWTGHSTRIIKLGDMGWVRTIEGNTGSGINVRDGDGVYERKRHIHNPVGKLRVMGTIIFEVKECTN